MTSRRKFIQGAAVAGPAALATPALAQNTITWRMQTYAGAALAAEVIEPAIHVQQDRRRPHADRIVLRRSACPNR